MSKYQAIKLPPAPASPQALANAGVTDSQVFLGEVFHSSSLPWYLARFPTHGRKPLEIHKKPYPPSLPNRKAQLLGGRCLPLPCDSSSPASGFNLLSAFHKRRLICQPDSQPVVLVSASQSPLEMEACPVVVVSPCFSRQ